MSDAPSILLPSALSRGVPLAILEDSLAALLTRFQSRTKQLDDKMRMQPQDVLARTSHKYAVDSAGNARIELVGIMLDQQDWILDAWAEDYTITPHFAAAIREAGQRADVQAIVIEADSPGGVVFGLQDAYEAIRDSSKPVIIAVKGMLCSAALYATAAADHITADPAAMIGSIGTLTTVTDYSQMAAKLGITVHLVASGPDKGTGTPGVPVTAERLKPYQELVDTLAGQFRAVVAEGRGLSAEEVQALATGAFWNATKALELGLIDSTSSTPLAAASSTAKEALIMNKEQLKALLAAHPQHAALINQLDDEKKTEAEVKAAISAAETKAKDAKLTELTAAVAKHGDELTAAVKVAKDAGDQAVATAKEEAGKSLKAEQDEHGKTKAALAKAERLLGLKPTHADVGGDDPSKAKKTMARADYLALSGKDRAAFINAGGTVLDPAK